METPARGVLRGVRSAALSVASMGLAMAGHGLAGGHLPGWGAVAVLTLVTSLVSVLLTGRRRGLVVIVAAMGSLQVVLHQGLVLLSHEGHGAGHCILSGHALHHADAVRTLCPALATATHAHELHASVTMLAAHVLATLMLAAILAKGEHALWAVVRLIVPTLPRAPEPLPQPPVRHPVDVVVVPGVWTSVSCLVRRGPPVPGPVVLT